MKLCIDICSGMGGFSAAFREDPEWFVITVDIEKEFEPIVLADVRYLKLDQIREKLSLGNFGEYEKIIVLFSPPCTYFSRAAGIGMFREGMAESLNIVAAGVRIIELIRPTGVIIENPEFGYLRFFLGKPNFHARLNAFGYVTVKPTAFWTNIALGLSIDSPRTNSEKNAWSNKTSKNPAIRAKMPYDLSKFVLEAVQV